MGTKSVSRSTHLPCTWHESNISQPVYCWEAKRLNSVGRIIWRVYQNELLDEWVARHEHTGTTYPFVQRDKAMAFVETLT